MLEKEKCLRTKEFLAKVVLTKEGGNETELTNYRGIIIIITTSGKISIESVVNVQKIKSESGTQIEKGMYG